MNEWLKNNLVTVGVLMAGIAVAWGSNNSRVMAIEARESELEQKVAEYPSKDYFTLKFSDIDTKLSSLELQLTQVAKQTK